MILAAISFLFLAILLSSLKDSLFFVRFVFKGIIVPNKNNLQIMNGILRSKKHPFFLTIFKLVLVIQSRIFLRKASRGERFISSVNLLIRTFNNYALNKTYTTNTLGKILQKYDPVFHKSLCGYTSPKAKPVINFWHNLSKINKDKKFDFHLTLKTLEDVLLVLLGNPIVNKELSVYRTDRRVIMKIQDIFGPRKEFLQNILGIAA